MLKNICLRMLCDLQNYKHDPQERLLYYMDARLNKSLNTYQEELAESLEYLSHRSDPAKIMRKIGK